MSWRIVFPLSHKYIRVLLLILFSIIWLPYSDYILNFHWLLKFSFIRIFERFGHFFFLCMRLILRFVNDSERNWSFCCVFVAAFLLSLVKNVCTFPSSLISLLVTQCTCSENWEWDEEDIELKNENVNEKGSFLPSFHRLEAHCSLFYRRRNAFTPIQTVLIHVTFCGEQPKNFQISNMSEGL